MDTVSFKSFPEIWEMERTIMPVTIRAVAPDDERFSSLRLNSVDRIIMINTETGRTFMRKFRAYDEIDSGPFIPGLFGKRVAKIAWFDPSPNEQEHEENENVDIRCPSFSLWKASEWERF